MPPPYLVFDVYFEQYFRPVTSIDVLHVSPTCEVNNNMLSVTSLPRLLALPSGEGVLTGLSKEGLRGSRHDEKS